MSRQDDLVNYADELNPKNGDCWHSREGEIPDEDDGYDDED